jgi:hypothetical protein
MEVLKNNATDLPNYEHPRYVEAKPTLLFLLDMWHGRTHWVDDLTKSYNYLPKESQEPTQEYLNRLKRSRFERRFRNAIDKDFAGLLAQFNIKDSPRSLLQYQDDVDLRGNSLRVFLREADKLALRDGYCFVLVDYPKIDEPYLSESDRLKFKHRPYLILINRSAVINWEIDYIRGKETLTRLVFKRTEYVKDGDFGVVMRELIYVLLPGAFVAYSMDGDDCVIARDSHGRPIIGKTSLDYIPISVHSLTDVNVLSGELNLPLLDLAEMNLELYQLESEKREILHKCNMPSLVIDRRNRDGFIPNDGYESNSYVVIGPNTVNYDCDMRWVEPTGNAIAATQDNIAFLNDRIDTYTLVFLTNSKVPRTATEADLNSTQARSNYVSLAIAKESSFNTIASIWADYEGETGNWQIECDRNLFKAPLDLSVAEVQNLYLSGVISLELCLSILKAKKVFGDNFSEFDLVDEVQLARREQQIAVN